MNIDRSLQSRVVPAPRGTILVFVYLLLFAFLYRDSFVILWGQWQGEDFSYGMLVPLVAAYLVWEQRAQLARIPFCASWLWLAPFSFGIFLYWLGELGGEYYTLSVSSWFVFIGLCLLHLGPKVRSIVFPLLLLLTMFPFPAIVNNQLTMRLKLLSSQVGVKLLQWYGMSAYREGNVIDLGFAQLQVVDACSGLRYFFPILIMGLLLGYFFRLTPWKWAMLVVATVPVIILNNGLRIAATGILFEFYGPVVAEGFFHDFAGWFTYMMAVALLVPLCLWLRRGKGMKTNAGVEADGRVVVSRTPSLVAVTMALLLLGGSALASQGVEFREKIPISKQLSGFPLSLGPWHGVRATLEQQFIAALNFSDYALIDYRDSAGKSVNFYVAYYESQRKGESIHSPSSCLPGGGWAFEDAGRATIDTIQPGGGAITVNRAVIRKGDTSQLTYYWFPQRGRILNSMPEMKFFVFWDALTRQRTDGALVRLITPVGKGEAVEAADARLQKIARLLIPHLDEHLPGS